MGALWLDGPDDVVCVHPGWPPVRGRDAVLRSWSMIMANTSYIQFVLTDVEVRVPTTSPSSPAPRTCSPGPRARPRGCAARQAVSTKVLRRTPGGWRVALHHSSPVMGTPGESPGPGDGGEAEDADDE